MCAYDVTGVDAHICVYMKPFYLCMSMLLGVILGDHNANAFFIFVAGGLGKGVFWSFLRGEALDSPNYFQAILDTHRKTRSRIFGFHQNPRDSTIVTFCTSPYILMQRWCR
jgi:hypothetical protein